MQAAEDFFERVQIAVTAQNLAIATAAVISTSLIAVSPTEASRQTCTRNGNAMPCMVGGSLSGETWIQLVDRSTIYFDFMSANNIRIRVGVNGGWEMGTMEWMDPGVFSSIRVSTKDGMRWSFPAP